MRRMNLTWLMSLWVLQGAIAAYIAHKKGRNPYLWFPIGCFFGIFGILGVIFIKPALVKNQPQALTKPAARRLPHFLWYYLDEQSKQHGPMSSNALEEELNQGKLSLSSYVWREGMAEWQKLDQVCKEFGV